jgi:CubicO group peptidase (beta-lactamase class C family)
LNDEHVLNGIVGSGSLYATLQDFVACDRALNDNKVVSAASLLEMYTPGTLNSGEQLDYGLGWGLDSYRGFRRVEHGGSWVGFRSGIARFPDQRLTVVVLTNCSNYEPEELIERISDIYLPAATTESL